MSTATTPKATPKTTAKVDKTGNRSSGRFTVKNLPSFDVSEASKPLFAAVGVADLAIEQVKDVPALYVAEAKKVQGRIAEVPAQVKTVPSRIKSVRGDVESQVEKASTKATDFYAKLAVRGERLVNQIRRQPATEAAIAEGKLAVKKAEAAANSAKRAVKAGEQAVEDAAAKIG